MIISSHIRQIIKIGTKILLNKLMLFLIILTFHIEFEKSFIPTFQLHKLYFKSNEIMEINNVVIRWGNKWCANFCATILNRHRGRIFSWKIETFFPTQGIFSVFAVGPPRSAIISPARAHASTHPPVWSLARFSLTHKVTMFTREALRANFFRVFHQREHKAIRRPARHNICCPFVQWKSLPFASFQKGSALNIPRYTRAVPLSTVYDIHR